MEMEAKTNESKEMNRIHMEKQSGKEAKCTLAHVAKEKNQFVNGVTNAIFSKAMGSFEDQL